MPPDPPDLPDRRAERATAADRLPANVIPMPGLDPASVLRDMYAGGLDDLGFEASLARDTPRLLPRPAAPRQLTVRLDLDGARPPIWRRLVLDGSLTLAQLHRVLQAAMGWQDTHLHEFRMGPMHVDDHTAPFLTDAAEAEGEQGLHERDVHLDEVLAEPGHLLAYDYDFGDGWCHSLRVETVEPRPEGVATARCLEGRRACPPENAGGVDGYEQLLRARERRGEGGEWDRHRLAWLGPDFDPEAFDVSATDAAVQRVAGRGRTYGEHRAPEPDGPPLDDDVAPGLGLLLQRLDNEGAAYVGTWLHAGALEPDEPDEETAAALTAPWRTLLRTVGEEGLALTGAGYLRPATVVELLATLPTRRAIHGKGNREEHVRPVAALRVSATGLGLVRKVRGRLLVTSAGRALVDDPVALLHHLAGRLPCGRGQHETDAGWLTLVGAAAGDERPERLTARILGGAGWDVGNGIEPHHARDWSRPTLEVLHLAGWNPDRWDHLEHDPRSRLLARLAVRG